MAEVPHGQDLREGCWYVITRIDPHDPNPSMKVGDVALCAAERPGCLDPENHESDGMGTQWFADFGVNDDGDEAYRTLVNGVVFLREAEDIASRIVNAKAPKRLEKGRAG
jgi:hypothetical protein